MKFQITNSKFEEANKLKSKVSEGVLSDKIQKCDIFNLDLFGAWNLVLGSFTQYNQI
jgi:hypothetical protein